jgi:2-succinyl-5-enolpyruvyl-6-hydroxy-3-cyclohexene-1-carboxylate synthase
MNGRDATTAFAAALVDEWARTGCTQAVVAPGSRSAPLALALARDSRMQVTVVLDERSAAYHALGIGRATGRPAVVCCTSGTAAANFHPAVLEAAHARVPMIVCTADRPPELRDTGAGQTIDQQKLYGDAVRWFVDPGAPQAIEGAGATWRSLACRAVAEAVGPPAGPVHLNLPFREPLVPTGEPLVEAPGRADGRPWVVSTPAPRLADDATVRRLAAEVRANPDGVLIAGWAAGVSVATVQRFTRAAGWPLLADAISNVRAGPGAISTYEALLRDERFAAEHRPGCALRVGAPLTSKVANGWLAHAAREVVIDPDDAWLDPAHTASERVAAEPEMFLAAVADALEVDGASVRPDWLDGWLDAERRARAAIEDVLDGAAAPFEGVVARDLAGALPDGAALVVASSLPVRALEWCMAPRDGLRVHANRGVNGIDGFVSTTLGLAAAAHANGPVVGFCGDLCFLHDTNGLLAAREPAAARATFVVVDNDGGGIFSFLPQRDLAEFEALFATPHGLDLVEVARAHGVAADHVDDLTDLKDALEADETRVLVLHVDRHRSVEQHRALWSAVASSR